MFPLLAVVWVGLLYAPTLGSPFVYDDVSQIAENPTVSSLPAATRYFTSSVSVSLDYLPRPFSFYRPLFWLSLALDYRLWGGRPFGFHLTNLILHAANGALLFVLLRRRRGPAPLAYGVPLVWLALPINTEVVAWVSGRTFSLATFWILLALLAIELYLGSAGLGSLIFLALASLAAPLSHECGILTPALALVCFPNARKLRSVVPLGAAWLASAGVYLLLRMHAGASAANINLGGAWQAPVIVSKYLVWMLLPTNFSIDRSAELRDFPVWPAGYAVCVAAAIGLVVAAVKMRDRIPMGTAGIFWMLAALLPFLNLVPLYQGMAERYAYLPSIGLMLALGAALLWTLERRPRWKPLGIAAAAIWLGWGVWGLHARTVNWSDEWKLYESSLRASPRSHVLLYNLGVKHAEIGQVEKAEALYRRAIALHPGYLSAKVNLANLLQRRGEFVQARGLYEQVLSADGNRKEALLNLGNLYQRVGQNGEAEQAYKKLLAADPGYAEAELNLAALYQQAGRLDQARAGYEQVLATQPLQPQAHANLGVLLYQLGRTKDAIEHLQRAIEVAPNVAENYFNLAVIWEESGQVALAEALYRDALRVKPGYQKAEERLNMLVTR